MFASRHVVSTKHTSVGIATASPNSDARSVSPHISQYLLHPAHLIGPEELRGALQGALRDAPDSVQAAQATEVGQQIAQGHNTRKLSKRRIAQRHPQGLHPQRVQRELPAGHLLACARLLPSLHGEVQRHRLQIAAQQAIDRIELLSKLRVILVGSDRSQSWTQPTLKRYREEPGQAWVVVGKRGDLRSLEIGMDLAHARFLIPTVPTFSPSRMVPIVKIVMAREVFAKTPVVKERLRGGAFWGEG